MSLILSGSDGVSDIDGTASTPAIRGTDANTGIFFPAADTIAFAEGGTESMRLDASGNVGIGTSSPTAKLEPLNTSTAPSLSSSAGAGLSVRGSSTVRLNMGQYPSSPFAAWIQASDNAGSSYDISVNPLGGNLLVGTTSTLDNSRLTVSQTGNNTCIAASTTSTGGSSVYRAVTSQTSMTAMVFLTSTSTTAGAISSSSTTTTYSTSSDYRLKENIAPMAGALAKIAQLKPVTYNWKSDGSAGQGFIAHELQAVVPDCVVGEKDAVDADGNPVYQGVDTSFLVATLTAAIQELNAKVEAQAAEIAALKNQPTE